MSAFLCVVLACVGSGLPIDRSPPKGSCKNVLKVFIVPEMNSVSEQAKGRDPCDI
jgi:hypothetical protein